MLLCDKGWYCDRLHGHESQFAGLFWPARCLAWQMHLFGHDQFPWLTVPKHSSSCQGGKTCTRPGIDPSICPQLYRNYLVRLSLDNCTVLKISALCLAKLCVFLFLLVISVWDFFNQHGAPLSFTVCFACSFQKENLPLMGHLQRAAQGKWELIAARVTAKSLPMLLHRYHICTKYMGVRRLHFISFVIHICNYPYMQFQHWVYLDIGSLSFTFVLPIYLL